jgi:tetratricopeptide (TPR) repeat protein
LSFDFQENDPTLENKSLKNWMFEVLRQCKRADNFEEAHAKIEPRNNEYSSSLSFNEKVPYSTLLLFYVSYKWDKYSEAENYAEDAIDEFKQRGKLHNQTIALWLRALAYEQENHIENAQNDINDALDLIERKLSDCKRFTRMKVKQNNYENIKAKLRKVDERLKKKLRNNVPIDRLPPEPPVGTEGQNNPEEDSNDQSSTPTTIKVNVPIDIKMSNQMRTLISSEIGSPVNAVAENLKLALPSDKFIDPSSTRPEKEQEVPEQVSLPWLPVYDQARIEADPRGKGFIDTQGSEGIPTAISHIMIEDKIYAIHVVKKSTFGSAGYIKLVQSRNYGWVKVFGNSMRDFNPRIEDGDYVLFYPQQDSTDDNVVIVKQPDESIDEFPHLIKEYKKRDGNLYSHNKDKNYPPLKCNEDCHIIGIVVAVAKLQKGTTI